MTANSTQPVTTTTRTRWADPVATDAMDGGYSGRITATRARSSKMDHEIVSVESELLGDLLLSPEQAAELAEILQEVSGMACGPRQAPFLADVVRRGIADQQRTLKEVAATAGVSRYRLRLLLSGKRLMRNEELKAISC